MTARDLRWRTAGAVLAIAGCTGGMLDRDGSLFTLGYFMLAIAGLVLLLNGKRIAVAWRAERHGHSHTAAAIHARRVARGVPRSRH